MRAQAVRALRRVANNPNEDVVGGAEDPVRQGQGRRLRWGEGGEPAVRMQLMRTS